MRLLLLGATEGLRYRLTDMLASAMPDAILVARDYSALPYAPPEDQSSDVILCVLGRTGEYLGALQQFADMNDNPATSIIALADDHESDLAGRALLAGAETVLPLPGLSPSHFVFTLKFAHAQKLRLESGTRRKEKLPFVRGYRVLRQIGEGGMSRVYLAQRSDQQSPVVLKIIDGRLAQDETFLLRFVRECELLACIQHENVVKLHDYSVDANRPYLAMEYFASGDLKSRISGGLPAITALKIMMQIAKAIDAVHSAGLVHRDLKPHNIMFRDKDRLALVDFGLAKPVDSGAASKMQLTQNGMILATPVYMSPEQCMGKQPDARADLYSCGVILFEMLAGKPPFSGDNPGELAYQHINAEVPQLPPRVAGFQGVVEKLLAKDPENRFQSAKELFAHIAI